MRKILFIVASVFITISCKKDKAAKYDPIIPNEPSIELERVSPQIIKEFDDIKFIINYQDGDGDLGELDPDLKSLHITDNRFPITHEFHFQPLAPDDIDAVIKGSLVVTLKNVILQNQNAVSEKVSFSIQLKDRKGNWSNTVDSPEITVNK